MDDESEDREYIATGTVELRNVTFIIRAPNIEEARQKASRGEYEYYDNDGAETINWSITPSSVE